MRGREAEGAEVERVRDLGRVLRALFAGFRVP
ncbi:hypothetical protein SAMN05428954_0086 [Streptomyces sp. 2112.3]|nr:hypothetical protein SAMN05428954_0086 [Streptomyces sp. 2112.3]